MKAVVHVGGVGLDICIFCPAEIIAWGPGLVQHTPLTHPLFTGPHTTPTSSALTNQETRNSHAV